MRIITISREFASGGRELGKRLADILEFDYYDSEIISAVARESSLDINYVENTLGNHGWQNIPLTFRWTIRSSAYLQASRTDLLVQQKKVIEKIAALGKDCIIVGRNADVILQNYHPFNIFVCADTPTKIRRCMERAHESEALTEKELLRKMREIDHARSRTRELMSGTAWGQRDAYHLTVNTSGWNLKKLAPVIADYANGWFGRDT